MWSARALRAQPAQPTPEEALARLMEGNRRFVSGQLTHPDQTPERRAQVAPGQLPFAMILGCADSRVPPEVIFDQGLGDLFVARVAGNIVNEGVQASMEYSLTEFESPLLMVLGHSNCGAVKETIEAIEHHALPGGALGDLMSHIVPAVEEAMGMPGDLLTTAIKLNVERSVQRLLESEPILAAHRQTGVLKVVGAYYDLESGTVVPVAT